MLDPNFRARGWSSPDAARAALLDVAPAVSLVLASFADEQALWGDRDPAAALARWRGYGVPLVVVKDGARGAWVDDNEAVGAEAVDRPVDTSGAGDAFNAGFVATLDERGPRRAARAGNRLAAQVVRHRGAVLPRNSMPALADL